MTKAEFIKHLSYISQSYVAMLSPKYTLPKLCEDLIVFCWVNQTPENEHVQILRYQYRHLQNHGSFDFEKK